MIDIFNNGIADALVGSTPVKKICVGPDVVWEKSSPSLPYDAQVEYLQTDGSAYIDTGLYLTSEDEINAKFYVPTATKSRQILGAGSTKTSGSSVQPSIAIYLTSTPLITYVFCNRVERRVSPGHKTGTHEATLNSRELIIDGVSYNPANFTGSFTLSTTLRLFHGYAQSNKPLNGVRMMWANVPGKIDLIAVRKNGIGYMYDRISGALFGNANTVGAFTYGNDVV